jgi:prepilin-type N-terminal cleavage/methylation domain-containing protein
MKKMRNKKGFTLVELLVVIGIIVVLSGATIVGVVSWVNNANNTKNKVLNDNGENFENDARLAVETFAGKAPEYVKEKETVNPITNTPGPVTETPTPGPVTQTPGTVTETPKPGTVTETPTPGAVTQTPGPVTQTPDPVTEKPKQNDPSYGSSGRPSNGNTTFASDDKSAASGTSVGISQVGDRYNNCQLKVTVPSNCTSFVIYIPGATTETFSGYNSNSVTNLGKGYYRFSNPNKVATQDIYSTTFKGATGAYVVEYTTV